MRTIVYVDGFNLYYGACRAPGRKWLDLGALCARLLPNDEIVEIAYCTANLRKDPRDSEAQVRQRVYHRALQMPVETIRTRLELPVTVINPILRRRGKRRNKALSPNPLPLNASFIQLRAKHIEESQFPAQIQLQGILLKKPEGW